MGWAKYAEDNREIAFERQYYSEEPVYMPAYIPTIDMYNVKSNKLIGKEPNLHKPDPLRNDRRICSPKKNNRTKECKPLTYSTAAYLNEKIIKKVQCQKCGKVKVFSKESKAYRQIIDCSFVCQRCKELSTIRYLMRNSF